MAKTKKLAGTPSVLAFARRIDPSDACMYRTSWGDRSKMEKLEVKTKTMRTVLSNRLKKKEAGNETGKALKESDPSEWQIHRSEYCTLGPDADTLVVRFTVKFLGGLSPYACNIPEYAETVGERIRDYMDGSTDTTGIGDLGLRYARNIAAASFLWRNRIGAENIKTEVVDDPDYGKVLKITVPPGKPSHADGYVRINISMPFKYSKKTKGTFARFRVVAEPGDFRNIMEYFNTRTITESLNSKGDYRSYATRNAGPKWTIVSNRYDRKPNENTLKDLKKANTRRLCETARESGARAYLLADASELRPEWIEGIGRVGITSGASAPEYLVQDLCARIRQM